MHGGRPLAKSATAIFLISLFIRLQIWETLVETRDIAKYQNICQVKRTLLYNYVYCFPFNITLPIGTVRAPPYTFRIPTSQAFEVPILKYTPIIRKLNLTGPHELPAVDSIHTRHFSEDSEAINQAGWFDKIQKLQRKIEGMHTDRIETMSIKKHGFSYYVIIGSLVLLISLCIGLTLHIASIRPALGTGSRVIDNESPTHTNLVGTLPRESRTNEQIKVGNDVSVVINLNRLSPRRTRAVSREM